MSKKRIPEYFNYNQRKVIDILIRTLKSDLPTTLSIISKETKLHNQTILDIVKDLREWGFMDKNEYKMNEEHFKKLEPHLEKNKKQDENFHSNWSLKTIIVVIISIGLISLFFTGILQLTYFKPIIPEFKVNITEDPYFTKNCSDFELVCQGDCKPELFKIIWLNENNKIINQTLCKLNK